MAEEEKHPQEKENSAIYYVIGLIALLSVVIAGYLLRPKPSIVSSEPTTPAVQITSQTTPITKLACEKQYYNPVVGLPKYYLSVEGVDVPPTEKVSCIFTVSVAGKTVEIASASSDITSIPSRGGGTFRCSTEGIKLDKNIPTKVDTLITNDQDITTSCSAIFTLP
ncbi:MAG: hypothetical protein Q7S76_00660 [bacterium]|nr:hypothetical protein [bacterium]